MLGNPERVVAIGINDPAALIGSALYGMRVSNSFSQAVAEQSLDFLTEAVRCAAAIAGVG
ncbi:hypothetical protein DSL92_04185 [Billgrantia gudaonensis]|uniref:Uncharacterized protein n=1 Tax=Billgrantia gudaonensis TaxID=376427 RepID=A0A3S0NE66_9GAMM|nr:hypothetical protein DSL92_04185 [Halomonas gudaonensis]